MADDTDEIATASAPSARAELDAEAALDLVRAGKEVIGVRVVGLKFRDVFEKPVRFRDCVLVKPQFDGATFRADVAFVACTIDRLTVKKPTTCEAGLSFGHTTLTKALFYHLTVKGKFDAGHAQFRGKVVINACEFGAKASFWEACFATWVDFQKCRFHDVADFRSVTCEDGFIVSGCHFAGDFLFRGSRVEKKLQLDGSRFEGLIDLSKAKLHDFAYLEAIDAGPNVRFAFVNTVAERIRVEPRQLEGRLQTERTGDFGEAMQEYGLLKQCYQKLHRYDCEDWAFYRFKVCQRKAKPVTWRRPWTGWNAAADWLFLDVGCGYGTSPARAVRMAGVIILTFAAIYAANVDLFYTEKLPFPTYEKTALPNRLMIGVTTSVSVFTSGMGGIRELAQGWMNVPVMVESVMGTLLFGLFIVAFSRKVIR